MQRTSAAAAAAVLLAATSLLWGCQRRADDAATTSGAPSTAASVPAAPADSPAAAPPAGASASAPLSDDVPPPEGVLRAYVWDCADGQTLRMKNLYRERAVTLEMHEGPRRLPQVVSGSGAKYSDGSLTFWTKGGEAVLERSGSPPVQCRELRAQSLLADARERGVIYVGRGNEPGWAVEVGPGNRISYVTNYGEERHDVAAVTERDDEDTGTRVYVGDTAGGRLKVTISRLPCQDDMSGESFDHVVLVEHGSRTYRGCGTALP